MNESPITDLADASSAARDEARPDRSFISEEQLADELWERLEPRLEDFTRKGIELRRSDGVTFAFDHAIFGVMAFCHFGSINIGGGPLVEGYPKRFTPPVAELTWTTRWPDEAEAHIDRIIRILLHRTS